MDDNYEPEGAPAQLSPPHDIVAEQSALGGMLLSKDAIADVIEESRRQDFYLPKHDVIFGAIVTLYSAGEPTDVVTVADWLMKCGDLQKAGGADYLHTLTSIVPTAANAGYYATIVHKYALRRHLQEVAASATQIAREGRADPVDAIEEVRQQLDAIGTTGQVNLHSIGQGPFDGFVEFLEAGHPSHVATPWWDINRIIGGLRDGSLNVIAARPAQGKSVIAQQVALRLAQEGPVAFVSLEMGQEEIVARTISQIGQVGLTNLLNQEVSTTEWPKIAAVRKQIQQVPLYVATSEEVSTITQVRAFARSVARKAPKGQKLAGVVVDYLQLLTSGERVESRQQEVSNFTRSLKLLARQLNCPVIALSQLNRAAAGRKDPRPIITDLRESGSIEQDADTVWLLHRDEKQRPNDLEIEIAKNRQGQNGRVVLQWEGMFARAISREWTPTPMFGTDESKGWTP